MKKLMNNPNDFVDQSLQGIIAAYPDFYTICNQDNRAVALKRRTKEKKVAIVTGGGYGHLPVFLGYVGEGLCDGVAVGNVFTSPSSESILNVSRQVEAGGGILFLFGNYTGDRMNFTMAQELLAIEDIASEIVTASDDVASAPREQWEERRGIAGITFAYKIAGACAESMQPLGEVARVAKKTVANTASYGFAFSSCALPDVGKPISTFAEDEMEIGMGIHGEPGVNRAKIQTSKQLAENLTNELLKDLSLQSGDQVAVLINGLGATSREELFIFYRDVADVLGQAKISTYKVFVGEFATSMEMAGASVTLLKLDGELTRYLDMASASPLVYFHTA